MEMSSIMIIDDSEGDQYLTKSIIKKFDPSIEVFQAYDGEEALEVLGSMSEQPSLILLDINMPRMDGFEFLEAYSAQRERSEVIVMLTTSVLSQDQEKTMTYNCVQKYFVKPLKLEDIRSL